MPHIYIKKAVKCVNVIDYYGGNVMGLKQLNKIKQLEKELEKLQAEKDKLKAAQKRCVECENFDKRRGFTKEQ